MKIKLFETINKGGIMTLMKRSNDLFPTLFEDFLSREWDNGFSNSSMPAVNIKETENEFNVEVAAPGMKKNDFKVELDNHVLTISYEKRNDNEEKDEKGRFTKREFNYASFERSFTLPNTVQDEKIGARYTDGILHLVIPKKEEAKTKPSRLITIS